MEKLYQLVYLEGYNIRSNLYTREQLEGQCTITGIETRKDIRKELMEEPKIDGYYGPMYNGEENGKVIIRYETREAYLQLSQ